IRRIIQANPENSFLLERDENWFTWLASTNFYANSKNELLKDWQFEIERLHVHLKSSKFLFITLGTSYAYRLIDGDFLVANCHKQPGSLFKKELLSLEQMKFDWKGLMNELKDFNPDLQLVFTVSPVRHTRDGIVENTRSKAQLHLLVQELQSCFSADYFPAFEILTDELRDYRFYSEDLVHPNQSAIDEIWKRFGNCYFTNETLELVNEVKKFKQFFNHRTLVSGALEKRVYESKKIELELFLKKHPGIKW
ncbi:MAG: GSCFA domain-containing protein, partial [Bacteroidetes bacterium]|nr:GSCFA domain-containing protein [Bacteroidota bacterium]